MALHTRSSSGFWRRLLVYAVFSISGGLIYWYTVDWRTYKDGVATVRAVPAGLLLFAQAVDWLAFPWSSAGHESLRRVADFEPGPRAIAWQLSMVLLYSFTSAVVYAWLATVVTGRIRSFRRPVGFQPIVHPRLVRIVARAWAPHLWLKPLLWTAGTVIFLLMFGPPIENWRGRRTMDAYLAELRARGDRLDFESVIPPSALPEENFAEIPLFQAFFAPKPEISDHSAVALSLERLVAGPSGDGISGGPRLWERGKEVDLVWWQRHYLYEFPHTEVPQSPAEDVLFALSIFGFPLAELKAAAGRPRSRFPLDYEKLPSISVRHGRVIRGAVSILALRASAALANHQSEAAAADVLLSVRLADASSEEPFLVSWLWHGDLLETAFQPLWEGLSQHTWADPDLAAIQERLDSVRLVDHFRRALRGERNFYAAALSPQYAASLLAPYGISPARGIPIGWYDQNRVALSRAFDELGACVDPSSGLVDQARVGRIVWPGEHDGLLSIFWHPYTFYARLCAPTFSSILERLVFYQENLDLARIAIALERYHLRHGTYAATLDSIDADLCSPGGVVFPDLAGGTIPHYRPDGEDAFTLYYEGWDQKDDHGEADPLRHMDRLDMVWPRLSK